MASNTHCCRIRLSKCTHSICNELGSTWLTLRVLQLSMQENLFGQALLVELQVSVYQLLPFWGALVVLGVLVSELKIKLPIKKTKSSRIKRELNALLFIKVDTSDGYHLTQSNREWHDIQSRSMLLR